MIARTGWKPRVILLWCNLSNICGKRPCAGVRPELQPCADCGQLPCVCERKRNWVITLSDGRARQIKHIQSVMYWSPEVRSIVAKEFVKRMCSVRSLILESIIVITNIGSSSILCWRNICRMVLVNSRLPSLEV